MTDKVIRVLVVDDNEMMRAGLCEAIGLDPGLDVVGTAGDATEALDLYRKLQPDVVTMDYQMPGENGLKCTERLLQEDPEAKVILISIFDSEEDIWNAVQAGVKGYLTKKAGEVDVLVEAIQQVANGQTFFTGVIAKKLERRSDAPSLTERELEVLKLLANGSSNKEAAVALDISEATVKFHIIHIREKLGAADRTDAVVKGFRRGILRVNDEPI
ncbi:response regulator [Pontiella sulfatireligans]|uniref:Transcriptional regulatory protein DegU n=1 Tax=Pontiella sulfatireligans TaxID=2750658 RepID=A0A6C2UR70_9BACT|nr:response regulator transcription factor [Pontiella sulfatireligans]VGO22443.1 Transcriptional regulatory protein DegU [Pontiella sulfatireligans]